MSESLSFMMGEFQAEFPTDRQYAKNHMWAMAVSNDVVRFGFSAYAVRLLQDVYFIDFDIAESSPLKSRQEFGNIESKKAESGLYSPISGHVVRINQQLLEDPSGINVDKYGDGWLLEMQGDTSELLSPQQYVEHLVNAWDVAQRTIKGQANTVDSDEE
ncbi:MAG: glycine cleavage system protein H [Pirellula sp.]